MKAILIARVSTEEQKEAGNSLPAQVARLEKYCQNKGFEIIKTCTSKLKTKKPKESLLRAMKVSSVQKHDQNGFLNTFRMPKLLLCC
jgi:predicted site-specific integrase-resolvase